MTKILRGLHILLAVIGVALLAILTAVLLIPVDKSAAATRFERAQLCIAPPVDTGYSRVGLSKLLSGGPPIDCASSVALPYRSQADEMNLRRRSIGPLGIAWYELRYQVPADWNPAEQLMIYAPRLMGIAWQTRVNDRIVLDNLDDWRMTWNRPLAVNLDSSHFKPGEPLKIAIGIVFEPQTGHALSHVSLGTAGRLGFRLAIREFMQFVMPFACSVTLLAMAVFFLLFWWSRRIEQTHLLLALSCIAWCVFNLQFVLPRRDDAVLDGWYSAVTGPAITWVMWLIYLFVLQLDKRFSRGIAIAMPPFVLLMSVIALPIIPLNEYAGLFYQGANVVVAALVAGRIGWMAIRGGSLELRVISGAMVIASLVGFHDWALLAQRIDLEGIYLVPFTSMLMFGAFLFAVQRRYVRAINEHEVLSSSLAQRLNEREAELQANHSRLLELERAQTLAAERQRLIHDMHDGLGSALTTSLAMIEQGNVDGEELKDVLRGSVDDLRAVIDSLEPLDGDLISVLATLRFRLGKRLELAGIALEWDMQDLPPLAWLGPPQALQLMRIVQEVLTNVLKHARASRMQISAHCAGAYVEVCIADNGRGFDVATTSTGRGLRHLAQRAASLHGSVLIESQPGSGTTVKLLLPVLLQPSDRPG
ncbi:MAG TPA: sensor histidine kinase [Steroidobacteraceae bacterium]|nr:sensor histidine kinase [Steroidobacteraceae bacterium]